MEWIEINCLIKALQLLVKEYESVIQNPASSEDDVSDASNDLAYAKILLSNYEDARQALASQR